MSFVDAVPDENYLEYEEYLDNFVNYIEECESIEVSYLLDSIED